MGLDLSPGIFLWFFLGGGELFEEFGLEFFWGCCFFADFFWWIFLKSLIGDPKIGWEDLKTPFTDAAKPN